MFVPLPKKDPLTIQLSGRPDNNNDTKRVVDLIPEVDGDNYATVDAESVSPTVTTTLFGGSNMSKFLAYGQSSQITPLHSLSTKTGTPN